MIRAVEFMLAAGTMVLASGCIDGGPGGGGGTGGAGGSGSSSGSSGPNTSGCGGAMCGFDQFCFYADGLCGAGKPGTCVNKPQDCDPADDICQPLGLVCGCDGNAYSRVVDAYLAGTDVTSAMNCM